MQIHRGRTKLQSRFNPSEAFRARLHMIVGTMGRKEGREESRGFYLHMPPEGRDIRRRQMAMSLYMNTWEDRHF